MKRQHLIVSSIAIALAGGAGYGIYYFGMSRGMQMAAPATAPGAAAAKDAPADGKKVLYWHDPMVPGQKFDKPGKSPFMDMQLVPVYADSDGDQGTVTINSRMQQNFGVRTAEVTRGMLALPVEAVGVVAYNDRDVALVQARSNGFVERLHVRAPLDPVRRGQPLADLYVPDWVAAQEEYLSARRLAGTQLDALVSGARQRMRLAGMNDAQIAQIESTGRVSARFTVTAPIDGVVTELGAREGMTVMSGAMLFRINGLGTVWINAEVRENQAGEVRPGIPVEARASALPGVVLRGKVNAILPEINIATRTLKVRVEVANPGGQLKPGMFATVNFTPAARRESLLVPTEAVIQTGKRSVVVIEQEPGKFAPVDVQIGTESGGQTEILKGLQAGQKVVLSGQFLIDSEANLKASTARMEGAEPGAATAPGPSGAGPTHHGEGKVESIEKDEVTLSHGPIPTLKWGPMTMGFKLPASGLPKNIAVGDSVAFEMRQTKDGAFEIVTIAPAKPK